MSQASQEAAEARREAQAMLSHYNVRWGPSVWRFQGVFRVEGRDNATLSEENPEADVLLRPQLNTRLWLPISEKNSLNLNLGVGYLKYLRSSDAGNIVIPSGTEVSLDLFVADAIINFHDRFTIRSDPYENPTLAGTRVYQRLENVAGTTVNWDLNRLKLMAGFDHGDYLSLNSTLREGDGRLESFYARAGYVLRRTTSTGLESGFNMIDYSDDVFRDALQYNGGPFWEGRLTDNIRFKLSAGYTMYSPHGGGTRGVIEDTDALYAQAAVYHRVNPWLTYSLSGGHTVQSGLEWGTGGRNLELSFVRWNGDWGFLRKFRIGTPLFYEHGRETGDFPRNFDRFGGGINIGRLLTEKLYGNVGYLFSRRESDQAGSSYDLNIISLNLTYTF